MAGTRSKRSVAPAPRQVASPSSSSARERQTRRRGTSAEPPLTTDQRRRSRSRQFTPMPAPPEPTMKRTRPRVITVELVRDDSRQVRNLPQLAAVQEERNAGSQLSGAELSEMTGRQLDTIDPLLAIESVPDLNAKADKFLQLLLSAPGNLEAVRRELMVPDSIVSRRFNVYKQAFAAPKTAFGASEYISPTVVSAAVNTNAYDSIMYKANIAILSSFLYTAKPGSDRMWKDLKAIEKGFPEIIGQPVAADNFELALDLRTHTLLMGIQKNKATKDFDAMTFFHYLFYEEAPEEQLRRWPGVQNYRDWGNYTAKRINDIMDVLTETPDEDIFGQLIELYPWDDFAERMVAYIRRILTDPEQKRKIKEAITKAEEFDGSFEPAEQPRPDAVQEDHMPQSKLPPVPITRAENDKRKRSSRFSASDFAYLRTLENAPPSDLEVPVSPTQIQPPLQVPETTGDDGSGETGSEEDYGSPTADDLFLRYLKKERENNKENRATGHTITGPLNHRRFIDPQPGAERVRFDSQDIEETQLAQRVPSAAEKGKGRKRPNLEEDDDNDDQEFQLDRRDENEDRRKRSRRDIVEPVRRQRQPSIPLQTFEASITKATPRTSGVSRDSGTSVSHRDDIPRNELVPVHFSPPRRSGSYQPERENLRSTSMTAMINMVDEERRKTAPQRSGLKPTRNRWTNEQSDALIEMIAERGPNWSAIEGAGHPDLEGRTNVNLKDKARNIKLLYLKNRMKLPSGFKSVTLSGKDRDALYELGIDVASYEQESDEGEGEEEGRETVQLSRESSVASEYAERRTSEG